MTNPTDANGRQRTPTDAPRPLREAVAEAIDGAAVVEMVTHGYESCWLENPEQCAQAAIAAMVTALLSETAVEAGASAVGMESGYYEYSGPFIGLMVQAKTTREADTVMARAALEAALRRIGATTDCGCTVTDAVDGVVDIDQCSRTGCPRAEGNGDV